MIAVSKFVFFNTILPAVDIGTDLHAYLIYSAYYDDDLDNYQVGWTYFKLDVCTFHNPRWKVLLSYRD